MAFMCCEISNLHNDFKKQVLINNCPTLIIFNFIVLCITFMRKLLKNEINL